MKKHNTNTSTSILKLLLIISPFFLRVDLNFSRNGWPWTQYTLVIFVAIYFLLISYSFFRGELNPENVSWYIILIQVSFTLSQYPRIWAWDTWIMSSNIKIIVSNDQIPNNLSQSIFLDGYLNYPLFFYLGYIVSYLTNIEPLLIHNYLFHPLMFIMMNFTLLALGKEISKMYGTYLPLLFYIFNTSVPNMANPQSLAFILVIISIRFMFKILTGKTETSHATNLVIFGTLIVFAHPLTPVYYMCLEFTLILIQKFQNDQFTIRTGISFLYVVWLYFLLNLKINHERFNQSLIVILWISLSISSIVFIYLMEKIVLPENLKAFLNSKYMVFTKSINNLHFRQFIFGYIVISLISLLIVSFIPNISHLVYGIDMHLNIFFAIYRKILLFTLPVTLILGLKSLKSKNIAFSLISILIMVPLAILLDLFQPTDLTFISRVMPIIWVLASIILLSISIEYGFLEKESNRQLVNVIIPVLILLTISSQAGIAAYSSADINILSEEEVACLNYVINKYNGNGISDNILIASSEQIFALRYYNTSYTWTYWAILENDRNYTSIIDSRELFLDAEYLIFSTYTQAYLENYNDVPWSSWHYFDDIVTSRSIIFSSGGCVVYA